jgi:site-specific DNA-methyltransferase (adenine-specific)
VSLQPNKIYQGDCVKNLKRLEAGSVDLIFADPPFNIGYKYDVYDDRQQAEDYLDWCRQWIGGAYQALKPDGTFWLAIGDEFAAELKIESQKAGFHCRSWVIWYYTFGVNCVNGFTRSHTHLFHFVKDKKNFTFNRMNPQVRVNSARQMVYGDLRANPNGRLPDNTWILRPQDAPVSFAPSQDTWYFARVAGTFKEREGFHGCQMPEQLLARIIRSCSNPQDLVVDPFGGSGTTMVVAKKLARQFVGFELSKDYVKYINQRIKRTVVGDSIDGPEDPIQSAPTTNKGRKLKKSFDEKTRRAVVEAFDEASDGYPVDFLLCDKEMAADFFRGCRERKLGGNATVWNRYLLELQSQKKLAKPAKKMPLASKSLLANVGDAAEVAWRLMGIDYQQALDEILTSPEIADEFDRLASEFCLGEFAPRDFRLAAWTIRKTASKNRKAAAKEIEKGGGAIELERLPFEESLFSGVDRAALEASGVFVLYREGAAIFAGQSTSMRQRIESMLECEQWKKLEPDSVGFVAEPKAGRRSTLRAALAKQEDAFLNARLLVQESEL